MLDLFRTVFFPPRDLILLVAAAWIGMSLSERRAARYQVDRAGLNRLILYAALAFVAGGRFFYAVEHLSAFIQNPLGLVSLSTSLFDPWGGCAAALITALVFSQRRGLSALPTLDALTPFLASIAVGIGFSHLATGLAFGAETSLPWGISLWGAIRQPTQIYEIIASLLILVVPWLRNAKGRPGAGFLLFVALTAASRLIIEGFRGDSTLVLGGLRAGQIIAWFGLALSLVALEILNRPQISHSASSEEAGEATESKRMGHRNTAPARIKRPAARKAKAAQPRPRPRKA